MAPGQERRDFSTAPTPGALTQQCDPPEAYVDRMCLKV